MSQRVIQVDEHIENADWIKARRWDLPTTLAGLIELYPAKDDLRHLLELPAAVPMPPELRAEVLDYLQPGAKSLMSAVDEIVSELRRRRR